METSTPQNTFIINSHSYLFFLSLSHSFFLSFSSFFFFHFSERQRSQSQFIIKIKAQQMQQTALQKKYWSSNFSVRFTHKVHMIIMTTVYLPWWCDWSEVFTHGLDNSSTPDPETHTDPNSSIKQQPDGSRCFLHYTTLLIDKPECDKGTNCIAGETEKHCLSYKNAHNCLERSLLFSVRFFFIVRAALLWLDPTGNTLSRLERLQQETLITLLFQLSLHRC